MHLRAMSRATKRLFIFRKYVAFYLADATNIYRDNKKHLRLVLCSAAGYALRFIIMKIVCEVDYLEDNEPIIYGPYAQRDCLDYNEFVGNEDGERISERANE